MHRANNFDLLRLLFALIVVLAHCHDLSLQPTLWWIPRIFSSRIAVEGFFAMSGYLIVASYDRSSSLSSYLKKRARRILPAYWAALIFSLVLGTVFTSLPASVFWQSYDTWKYILANLSLANFLHPALPGLFVNNPAESAVNGALWTIKVEVLFYLSVPGVAVLCRRFGKWQALSTIFFLSICYRALCEHTNHPTLATQFPGQLSYFIVGSMAYYYHHRFREVRTSAWIIALSTYILYLATDWMALRAFSVPLLVLCFAFFFPRVIGPTKYGDFSYGIYVFHCPIIQTLVGWGMFLLHPTLSVAFVVLVVTLLAVASWNLIERPSLGRKPEQRLTREPVPAG
jgi:peptidoglycan/LPS O-acetylase OafA/YrhL